MDARGILFLCASNFFSCAGNPFFLRRKFYFLAQEIYFSRAGNFISPPTRFGTGLPATSGRKITPLIKLEA
jgi:hypothetical protein